MNPTARATSLTSLLATVAFAATACSGSSAPQPPSESTTRQSPVVRKANALCRREDAKIAAAEEIATGVWFTANTVHHINAEANGLVKLGLGGTLARSLLDWEQARSLLLAGNVRYRERAEQPPNAAEVDHRLPAGSD